MSTLKEQKYFVKGTHCASCEILIEKKLLEEENIKSVEASNQKGEVLIEYENEKPSLGRLNNLFQKDGYVFSEKPIENTASSNSVAYEAFITIGMGVLVILGFLFLNKLGFSKWVNVSQSSSLPAFFLFGLLAGLSTCAALVGGLVLSMSKQWGEIYADKNTTMQKATPHLMFNAGRLASYALLGGVLGAIGAKLQLSLSFSAILVLAVSVLMLFLALQMLGVKAFRRFQITMPKFMTRYVANEKNFKGKYMPFAMGGLTFFLPCGFTITAQGLALISGSFLQGGLIMLFFALGTLPVLLSIGFSSSRIISNPKLSQRFLKAAGIVVLFFALFNINNQMNVLGYSNVSELLAKTIQPANNTAQNNGNNNTGNNSEEGLPPIVNGKQVIKMDASASGGYSPNYFKLRVGVPVRWEITDKGTNGCTNTIVSRSLFGNDIKLTPGKISIQEFTPDKVGKFKFSCWMGMVSGIMEVVDPVRSGASNGADPQISSVNNNPNNIAVNNSDVAPSGAKGCGCEGN
ncbi:MAG: sulfite exporter TauE/SafE family protein [Candidatus Pacebacteria bacterium]|nr:sulfite exporter TauE/SafE family protein [Candidatus Paceibacterota bacterium]